MESSRSVLSICLPFWRGSERWVVSVAEDDAGAAGARSNMVEAIADAGEAVVDADRIRASSVVTVMRLSEPMVQVIWPTVNVRPFGITMDPGMMTILFFWEVVRTPPTWRTTVDEIWSAVYLGVCPR